ncbi:MAG: hypothetical protein Q9221_003381 [Calogaya cf. arnoldii]
MPTLIDALPVLLEVIDLLDVSSLLALRHTCRSTHHFISSYESSIVNGSWNRSHARYSFPECRIEKPKSLKDLFRLDSAYQLACTVVASEQPIGWHGTLMRGIGPNEAFGDELRARVTKGLLVWHTLSCIANHVTAVDNETNKRRFQWAKIHVSKEPTSRQKGIEEGVLGVWGNYLDSLDSHDIVNLVLTEQCVKGKIRLDGVRTGVESKRTSRTGMRTVIEWRRPLWSAVEMDREPEALRWLVFFLLRKGPGILTGLWCENPTTASAAESQVLADICSKSLKLILLEDKTRNEFIRKTRRPIKPAVPGCDNAYNEACEYYMSTYHFRTDFSAYQGTRQEVLARRHDETLAAIMTSWVCTLGTSERPGAWRKQFTTRRWRF